MPTDYHVTVLGDTLKVQYPDGRLICTAVLVDDRACNIMFVDPKADADEGRHRAMRRMLRLAGY